MLWAELETKDWLQDDSNSLEKRALGASPIGREMFLKGTGNNWLGQLTFLGTSGDYAVCFTDQTLPSKNQSKRKVSVDTSDIDTD